MKSIAPSYKTGWKNLGSFAKRGAIESLWRRPTVPGRLLPYILTLMAFCCLAINLIPYLPGHAMASSLNTFNASKAPAMFDMVLASNSMGLVSSDITTMSDVRPSWDHVGSRTNLYWETAAHLDI